MKFLLFVLAAAILATLGNVAVAGAVILSGAICVHFKPTK